MFQNCLNKIRLGIIDENVKNVLNSRIGVNLENEFGIKATKLYSKNYSVDEINNKELDKLAQDDREFYQYEIDINISSSIKNPEYYLTKFQKYCNAPLELELCIGAQVMLLYNMDISEGLVNGSRGVVVNFIQNLPVVKFINGAEHIINYHNWDMEENDKTILSAEQIPLKIAYAISIHKCQGSSLDCVEIDLGEVFEYGQAYVALSRVKSLEGLSIIDINYKKIMAHPLAVQYYQSKENIELNYNYGS